MNFHMTLIELEADNSKCMKKKHIIFYYKLYIKFIINKLYVK